MILTIFDLQVSLIYFLLSIESTDLSVQERSKKTDFQAGLHGGHLGFQPENLLAIFDLQVALILPMKFRINWPFC